MTHISSEQFLQHLRSALNHLYDPYFLRKSPLVSLFGLGDEPDAPAALQRILNQAIAALEPKEGGPNLVQSRRNYELIMYRYVQQFGQEEVSAQLGVSVRHLRREQNAAIFSLGAQLWERYRLGARPLTGGLESEDAPAAENLPPAENAPAAENAPRAESTPDGDLDWLKDTPLEEPAVLDQVLPDVLELSRPLAAMHGVELLFRLEADLPPLAVQPVALRQLLLNLLSVAVPCAEDGQVEIGAGALGTEIIVELRCPSAPGQSRLDEGALASLDIAARMARLCDGRLECSFESGPGYARLALPAFRQLNVLVIDDNPDFIQLLQRDTTGTRYKVTGARDPQQGLRLAEEQVPDAILLDVMMPRVDGWEILGRLRRHPRTGHIPVIICTILAQEELARSLGARDFLRKPVTREKVLAALDRLAARPGPPGPGSR
jgi:CheY-like chemotaxis protein